MGDPKGNTSIEGKLLGVEGATGAFGKLDRVFRSSFFGVQLERELYQPIDQLPIGQAGSLPQLGVHTDGSKPGDSVEFVDVYLAAATL